MAESAKSPPRVAEHTPQKSMPPNHRSKPCYRFDADGMLFVLGSPHLARPWTNWMCNDKYGLAFSNEAGGRSAFPLRQGIQLNRGNENSTAGKYVYLRDSESREIWTTSWQPAQTSMEAYKCIHGLGYSILTSTAFHIESSFRIFVHPTDPVEMWTIQVTNRDNRKRHLKVYPVLEWSLADTLHAQDDPSWYTHAAFDTTHNAIIAHVDDASQPGRFYEAFMAAQFPIAGYTCSREAFLGMGRDWHAPEVVMTGSSHNHPADLEPAVGCFETILELDAGQTATRHLVIGMKQCGSENTGVFDRCTQTVDVDGEFERLRDNWDGIVKSTAVSTPLETLDRTINIWAKYQLYQCHAWVGGGGYNNPMNGYRDVLQFAMGMVHFDPGKTKETILEALRYQYADGRALRSWSNKGSHDTRDYRDSPVWIIFALISYLKETGDFDLLNNEVPYLAGGNDSVLAHAVAAVKALFNDRGQHGLSHIGGGDWLDPLNMVGVKGKGESVWLSMALHLALTEMAVLFTYLGGHRQACQFREEAEELKININDHGWDGEWYLRAYDDDGNPVGSSMCEEGSIFLNPQAWAVMSGVGTPARIASCFASVEKHLRTPFGYRMFAPPYQTFRENIGQLSILGMKDMVYLHTNAFKMVADCMRGHGTEACETFNMISPENPRNPPEVSRAEPYLLPNGYLGPWHGEKSGRVMYSGFTGTVPWTIRWAIERLIGLRADYDGLIVDPCIPPDWDACSLTKSIRGTRYNLTVSNPEHVSSGVKELRVDGDKIADTKVGYCMDGREHNISCILGSP